MDKLQKAGNELMKVLSDPKKLGKELGPIMGYAVVNIMLFAIGNRWLKDELKKIDSDLEEQSAFILMCGIVIMASCLLKLLMPSLRCDENPLLNMVGIMLTVVIIIIVNQLLKKFNRTNLFND